MIRRDPNGDIPVVHDMAFVDPTAILCGKVIVEANVFIGPYAVIRADEVNDDGGMEPIIIPSTTNVHSDADLARIEPVTPDQAGFSESMAQANSELVKGYKRIRNEF